MIDHEKNVEIEKFKTMIKVNGISRNFKSDNVDRSIDCLI